MKLTDNLQSRCAKWVCGAMFATHLGTQVPTVLAGEVELIKQYPIEEPLFTQGLELNSKQELILGTGLKGESKLGIFNLETGVLDSAVNLPADYFGEGLTHTDQYLWQMTWREKIALKRDPETFEVLEEVPIETEGWGLCYDKVNQCLWRSDGTNKLYKHDPETFEQLDVIEITREGKKFSKLNELEWVDGALYANRLYDDYIYKIDLEKAEVIDRYDMRPIVEETLTDEQIAQIDSLNGIAHIEGDRFYVTGKLYPYLYEVILK